MTLSELKAELTNRGVPEYLYSLSGGLPNEAYCLERVPGAWLVYYSERGVRSGLTCFDSEDAACDHLFRLIHFLQ